MIYSQKTPILLNCKLKFGYIYRLNGVGFKSFVSSSICFFQLGYSHYLGLKIPFSSVVRSSKQNIALKSIIGNFRRQIENLRKPDSYKGRGIHIYGQKPKTKEGKRR